MKRLSSDLYRAIGIEEPTPETPQDEIIGAIAEWLAEKHIKHIRYAESLAIKVRNTTSIYHNAVASSSGGNAIIVNVSRRASSMYDDWTEIVLDPANPAFFDQLEAFLVKQGAIDKQT